MNAALRQGSQLCLALVLLALLAGCAGTEQAFSAPAPSQSGPYVIGTPDLLRVTVWKHPDLSVEAPVRRDGKISVPLLDDVQASGLTPESLGLELTRRLSEFVTRPAVTVIVLSPDSQTVTVVGGVTNSGAFPLRRDMGVLEAVAAAGGFNAWANKNDVRVIRSFDGKRETYRFDYRAYLAGEAEADIRLRPGDVVVVPE